MVLVVQEQNVGILCVTRLDCSLQLFPQIVLLPDGLRNIMGRAIMAAHSFLLRSECLIYNTQPDQGESPDQHLTDWSQAYKDSLTFSKQALSWSTTVQRPESWPP